MKKIYQYTMVLLAGVLGACSSMSVSDPYAENLPAGFDATTYMNLHPELRTVQIKDYVAAKNTMFKDSVKKAGGDYDALKAADDALFTADVASLAAICADSFIGGYDATTCAGIATNATLLTEMAAFNFTSTAADYAALTSIPVDEVAISQQFVVFGQTHGWAYRLCTEAESQNPARKDLPIHNQQGARAESTEGFVADTGLYCRDAAGVDRLIQ